MSGPLFSVHDVSVARGERILVEQLSFFLGSGEILVLRGANGAGKTSLLRVLAGITPPQHGYVSVRDIRRNDAPVQFASHVAYWGHKDGFRPALTALANLEEWAGLHARGIPPDLLSRVGLSDKADTPVRFLSAGQRRRLGIARLFMQQADVWLLDEPFTALDSDARAGLLGIIQAHCAGGGCAILALHQPLEDIPHTVLTLGAAAPVDAA